MTKNLTQTRMINNFAEFQVNMKGDRYWRLKYLMLRAFRNPVDEIAFKTAKHKRILPISVSTEREHVHETLNFLAVIFFFCNTSHFQWVREFLCLTHGAKSALLSISDSCVCLNSK